MNSLKNLTALVLAVLMLASMAVIGVSAEGTETMFNVTAASNLGESSLNPYDSAVDDEVVVNFQLTSADLVANSQGFVKYDSSVLEVKSFELSPQLPNPVFNTETPDIIKFNSTSDTGAGNFKDGASFVMIKFKILATQNTKVELYVQELCTIDDEYNRIPLVADGAVCEGKNVSAIGIYEPDPEPTDPTESTATTPTETQPTTETQAPTQAPATTIKVKAAKTTIYVKGSTTVKATVTNPVGSTTFKSSNTKVATVTSKGKVVGKKAGSVTITATNNGKSASVKIKVVKKTNPMTVKAKTLSLKKGYKTKTFVKAKAFTVKNAKGTVVFKKTKGNKSIAVASKGKVTVKAGLKKGTYNVKVKVTAKGNTEYKPKTKSVTLKVVIK